MRVPLRLKSIRVDGGAFNEIIEELGAEPTGGRLNSSLPSIGVSALPHEVLDAPNRVRRIILELTPAEFEAYEIVAQNGNIPVTALVREVVHMSAVNDRTLSTATTQVKRKLEDQAA
jgi:hypothetical protein